jgi:hypothetical protein
MNRFTKLDSAGSPLADDASTWVAVLDNTTSLIWTAGNVGDEHLEWSDAKAACAALTLCEQSDWRMPSVEELFALADRSCFSPAIDTAFFPLTKNDRYWSSTPDASSPAGCAWFVYFDYGSASVDFQNFTAFVRAVRSARASQ